MTRVYIEDFKDHVGEEVEFAGWLFNSRRSGKLMFLILRDGSGIAQAVLSKKDVGEEMFEVAKNLTQETSLIARGQVREDERAPGGYELTLSHIEQVGASVDYPIALKEHGDAFLLDNRHLWLRSRKQWAVLRIRHEVSTAIRDFFNGRGFIAFDTPIFTPNAVEGTTTLFSTD
ncbi:asparagine--tRNA ligase, partial [bacterium]|nr:asparagine--tRNA ligase [bacterium]